MNRFEFIKAIRKGINIGNALECYEPCVWKNEIAINREVNDENGYHDFKIHVNYQDGTERDYYYFEELWSNAPLSSEYFAKIHESGFTACRIMFNISLHYLNVKTQEIDPLWIKRLKEVIDMCIANKLIAIITLHTDFMDLFHSDAWPSLFDDCLDETCDNSGRFMKVWTNIANEMQSYSPDELAFDFISELRFNDLNASGLIEKANSGVKVLFKRLVNSVRQTGGNNSTRFLFISGYYNEYKEYKDYFIDSFLSDFDQYCILTTNYYEPWQFCNASITNTWGTEDEIKLIKDDFDYLSYLLSAGIPIIITEYGAGVRDPESMDEKIPYVKKYIENIVSNVKRTNISAFLWDPGYLLKRDSLRWTMPEIPELIKTIDN